MLILNRRAGESLMIGDEISISIISVKKGQVRLAISAPVEVPILRSELLAVTQANLDAVAETADPGELLDLLHSVGGAVRPRDESVDDKKGGAGA